MRLPLIVTIFLALFCALPLAARPLGTAEAKALDKAVTAYFTAIGKGDAQRIVATMPPRLVAIYAGATGLENDKLRAMLVEQTAALMAGTTFRDLTADQTALDAAEDELADGSKIVWVLVPTTFIAETGSSATRNDQPLLAVQEAKEWYFLRIDGNERRAVAALAYPFLAGVDFPEGKTAPVE